MHIRILGSGTSQGIPVIGCRCKVCISKDPRDKRLRTSALISTSGTRILIDAGPDFRQQFLAAGADDVDAILISHEHNDHISGLDDVRPINFRWRKVIPLFTDQRVMQEIRTRFSYIFNPDYHYPGKPRIALIEHGASPFKVADVKVIPIRVFHGELPIWGYRIGDFAYITDAKFIPEEEIGKLGDLHVLVLNALQIRQHGTHFNLEEALEMASTIGAERTCLTHLSHDLGKHEDLVRQLPTGVELCYDGLEIAI